MSAFKILGTDGQERTAAPFDLLVGSIVDPADSVEREVSEAIGLRLVASTLAPVATSGSASDLGTGTLPAARLPSSGVSASTYGSGSLVPVITVDATGRITSATTAAVSGGGSGPPLGSAMPLVNGTAVSGTSSNASHEDHVHPIDTSRQAADATLTALAGVTTAADQIIYATGSDAFATTAFPAQARTLLAATTVTTQRSALSAAASGANSDITSLTGLTTALSIAQGGTGATSGPAALTSLGAQAVLTMATGAQVIAGTSTANPVTPKSIADAEAIPSSTGSGSWAPNLSTDGISLQRIASGSSTVAPTGGIPGRTYALWLTQDATGSRTWAFAGSIDFRSTGTPTPSTGASKTDFLFLYCTVSGSYVASYSKSA